jgi:RNA polymerase sigma-70 factor (ECF subfamily)
VLADTRTCLGGSLSIEDTPGGPVGPQGEEHFVSMAQEGDAEAFCALVEPYFHQIYFTALKITHNHADAEDASQECLVKAFKRIQTFRRDSKFSTWLIRIAINESLMMVRKRRAELKYVIGEKDWSEISSVIQIRDRKSSSNPEASWMQKERNELLKEAVGKLGAEMSLMIHLFAAGEIRTREISSALQISNSGVNARLRRAFRRLRGILTEKFGGRDERVRGWV